MLRSMAVAGSFYPAEPAILNRELDRCLDASAQPRHAVGCVVPHAGYIYSGHIAGAVFSRVQISASVILLCPNHTGRGRPLAIVSKGAWETPLGEVPIEETLATALRDNVPGLEEDEEAHRTEHSLEVQLPFLLRVSPAVRIVPIAVGTGNWDALAKLGSGIADVLQDVPEKPLIVASSDMNHYEADGISRQKDNLAIEQVLALDPHGLYETIHKHNISMCGYGPTIAMLTAARMLGAEKGELVGYANSGEVTGDRGAVVGYAGILIR